MRKTVVCVFAHPDDEAFGPAGTIALMAKTHDIYVLCATKGEAGKKDKISKIKNQKLGDVRVDELRKSAKILGVKEVFFLGFEDGTLSNNLYHELADKIQEKLEEYEPEIVITYDLKGVSGHIDHITVAMATVFVAQKLPFVKEIWQYCILEVEGRAEYRRKYFIYFPPGYKESEIDKAVDIQSVWEQKVKAMQRHQSQMHDVKRVLSFLEKQKRKEYFLVVKNLL